MADNDGKNRTSQEDSSNSASPGKSRAGVIFKQVTKKLSWPLMRLKRKSSTSSLQEPGNLQSAQTFSALNSPSRDGRLPPTRSQSYPGVSSAPQEQPSQKDVLINLIPTWTRSISKTSADAARIETLSEVAAEDKTKKWRGMAVKGPVQRVMETLENQILTDLKRHGIDPSSESSELQAVFKRVKELRNELCEGKTLDDLCNHKKVEEWGPTATKANWEAIEARFTRILTKDLPAIQTALDSSLKKLQNPQQSNPAIGNETDHERKPDPAVKSKFFTDTVAPLRWQYDKVINNKAAIVNAIRAGDLEVLQQMATGSGLLRTVTQALNQTNKLDQLAGDKTVAQPFEELRSPAQRELDSDLIGSIKFSAVGDAKLYTAGQTDGLDIKDPEVREKIALAVEKVIDGTFRGNLRTLDQQLGITPENIQTFNARLKAVNDGFQVEDAIKNTTLITKSLQPGGNLNDMRALFSQGSGPFAQMQSAYRAMASLDTVEGFSPNTRPGQLQNPIEGAKRALDREIVPGIKLEHLNSWDNFNKAVSELDDKGREKFAREIGGMLATLKQGTKIIDSLVPKPVESVPVLDSPAVKAMLESEPPSPRRRGWAGLRNSILVRPPEEVWRHQETAELVSRADVVARGAKAVLVDHSSAVKTAELIDYSPRMEVKKVVQITQGVKPILYRLPSKQSQPIIGEASLASATQQLSEFERDSFQARSARSMTSSTASSSLSSSTSSSPGSFSPVESSTPNTEYTRSPSPGSPGSPASSRPAKMFTGADSQEVARKLEAMIAGNAPPPKWSELPDEVTEKIAAHFNGPMARDIKVKLRQDVPPFPQDPAVEQLGVQDRPLFRAQLFHYDAPSGTATGVLTGGNDVSKPIVVQVSLKPSTTDTEEVKSTKAEAIQQIAREGSSSISGGVQNNRVNLRPNVPNKQADKSRSNSIPQPEAQGGDTKGPSRH